MIRLSRSWPLQIAGALAVSFILILSAVAAPLADGPYVVQQAGGAWMARWVEGDDAAPKTTQLRIEARQSLVVPAVGALPSFEVRLRASEPLAANQVQLPATTPLFVVADTHGEYEILGELLQKQRIVDASLRWSFGKGHLVFLGDVFDRGPNQIEILWLIYELQAQAARAGGGVHLLLGNHETMVMGGDLRYLNPKYIRVAELLDAQSYADLVGPHTVLGQWLRTRPAVLKIRGLLCLHGGISRELVERGLTLKEINGAVRRVLNNSEAEQSQAVFVMGPLGPLWYRGYFADQGKPAATSSDIDSVLRHFDVAAILVGHTRVPTVTALYDQRVVAVQVYPRRDDTTGKLIMEALRIEGSRFMRAKIDGALEPLSAARD